MTRGVVRGAGRTGTAIIALVAIIALTAAGCTPEPDTTTPPPPPVTVASVATTETITPETITPETTPGTTPPADTEGSSSNPLPVTDACRLETPLDWTQAGHRTDLQTFLHSTGTLRAVMVFVDFADARAEDNPDEADRVTQTYYDELGPAAADWLHTSSFGALTLEIEPTDEWLHLSRTSAAFGITRGLSFRAQESYVQAVVDLAESSVDFSRYDLVYIVPSRNAAGITFSPAYINEAKSVRTSAGIEVSHGVTFGHDVPIWGYRVLVHETLHTFGLPDLYRSTDATAEVATDATHEHVGGWDIMGDILGAGPDLFTWQKWKLGWVDDDQVACVVAPGDATITLDPVEDGGPVLAAVVPIGPTTAIVAEHRRAAGLDEETCENGVLVYRVDTSITSLEGPLRVHDATATGGPACARFGGAPLDLATPDQPETAAFVDDDAGVSITLSAEGPRATIVVRRDRSPR